MVNGYILAYDFGTSGVKAAIINMGLEVLTSTTAQYDVITSKAGWVEQDPKEYWRAIIKSTREILEKSKVSKDEISGMVFSTQSMGIIPVDEGGKTLYNNITWVDGRAGEQAKKVNSLLGAEVLGAKDVICKLLWLKENRPDIYDNTKYFLDVNGFLKFKATGIAVAEYSGASSYGLDLEKKYWLTELFNSLGLETNKLPPLVAATDRIGGLTKQAAKDLELKEGIPVFGGCDDVQSATIGSGASQEGEGHIYLGSSAWLCVSTSQFLEMKNGAAVVKSADPDRNVVVGVTQSAGMSLEWAIDKFYRKEREDESIDEYAFIDHETRNIRPGSDKLIITPWMYGEYCPITSESLRTTMFNLTNLHTRAHIIKAVCEGIAYNLRWIKENYQQDYGIELHSLRVIGGGALNDGWMQILADVLQVKIQITRNIRYAGAIGAAVCSMIGLGVYDSFSGMKEAILIEKEYIPMINNKEIYDMLFDEYKELYNSLKASYERISKIV